MLPAPSTLRPSERYVFRTDWVITDAKSRHAEAHGEGTAHASPMPQTSQNAQTPSNVDPEECTGTLQSEPSKSSNNLAGRRSQCDMAACTHPCPPCSKSRRSAFGNLIHEIEGAVPNCLFNDVACCALLPWRVVLQGLSSIHTLRAGGSKQCSSSAAPAGMCCDNLVPLLHVW